MVAIMILGLALGANSGNGNVATTNHKQVVKPAMADVQLITPKVSGEVKPAFPPDHPTTPDPAKSSPDKLLHLAMR